jgi:hypothetical protein
MTRNQKILKFRWGAPLPETWCTQKPDRNESKDANETICFFSTLCTPKSPRPTMVQPSKQSLPILTSPLTRRSLSSSDHGGTNRKRTNHARVLGLVALAIFVVVSIRNLVNSAVVNKTYYLDSTLSLLSLDGDVSIQLACDAKRPSRHSSRFYKAGNVQSIFNCDGPNGKCQYFYPANFFDAQCGLAKKFHHMVITTEEKLRQRKLWLTGPQIGFHTLVLRETGQLGGTADETDDGEYSGDNNDEEENDDENENDDDQEHHDNNDGDGEHDSNHHDPHAGDDHNSRETAAQYDAASHQHHYHDKEGHIVFYTSEQRPRPRPNQPVVMSAGGNTTPSRRGQPWLNQQQSQQRPIPRRSVGVPQPAARRTGAVDPRRPQQSQHQILPWPRLQLLRPWPTRLPPLEKVRCDETTRGRKIRRPRHRRRNNRNRFLNHFTPNIMND